MRRNCNLELGLAMPLQPLPPQPADKETEYNSSTVGTSKKYSSFTRELKQNDVVHAQKEMLTIFYDGRVCVRDVTELQAKAILEQARQETERQRNSHLQSTSLWRMDTVTSPNFMKTQLLPVQFSNSSPTSSTTTSSSTSSSTSGERALKRSLQRFLEKRKNRIATASPY